MKKLKYIAFVAALLGVACTGYTDEADNVAVLKASRSEIFADGADKVALTVTHKGVDVTAQATFAVSPEAALNGTEFVTEQEGTYTFTATYDGKQTKPVTVKANKAELTLSTDFVQEGETNNFTVKATYGTVDVSTDAGLTVTVNDVAATKNVDNYYVFTTQGLESKLVKAQWNGHEATPITVGRPTDFYKRVGVLEFTGTWCQYCTHMIDALNALGTEYPDRNVTVAVHARPEDQMTTPIANTLLSRYVISGMPAVILDMNGPAITRTTLAALKDPMSAIVDARPDGAACGLALETSIEGNEAVVTVKLLAAETREFSLAVALLESGITGYPQLMPNGSYDNNYTHNHVLREFYQGNIDGVSVGTVEARAQESKDFRFNLGGYNPANCSIVVFANSMVNGKMTTMNATECHLGESVNFEYE
jgi:thiol-disulfide isomerase/thioredoxin